MIAIKLTMACTANQQVANDLGDPQEEVPLPGNENGQQCRSSPRPKTLLEARLANLPPARVASIRREFAYFQTNARRTRYRYLRQGGAALVALRGLTLGASGTHPQCPTRKTTALANCLKLPFLSCTLWISLAAFGNDRQVIRFSVVWAFRNPAESRVCAMKILLVITAALALNSCNTLIGLGRDTKRGYQWTKSKFEDKGSEPDPSGAPVY